MKGCNLARSTDSLRNLPATIGCTVTSLTLLAGHWLSRNVLNDDVPGG
jgi:hypothetical protein